MTTTTLTRREADPAEHHMSGIESMSLAIRIAQRAVVADLQSEACCVYADGVAWYDTRRMVDVREHAPEVIDMATEAITWGLDTGLLIQHPDPAQPWLLRVATSRHGGTP